MTNPSSTSSSDIFRFLKKVLFYALIIYGINLLIGMYAIKVNRSEVWTDFNSDKNYDVVFTGSSHSAFGYNPILFDSLTGYNSFNLSTPAQSPKTAYIVIDYIIKKHKPKFIILDNFFYTLYVDNQFQNEIQPMSQFEPASELLMAANEHFSPHEKVYFMMPVAWNKKFFGQKLKGLFRSENIVLNNSGNMKGFFSFPDQVSNEKLRNSEWGKQAFSVEVIDKEQIAYLEKICELCKVSNVTLIMTTLPLPKITEAKIKEYSTFKDLYSSIFTTEQVTYIDQFESIETLNDTLHFKDPDHLNYKGAAICTAFMANYINSIKNNP